MQKLAWHLGQAPPSEGRPQSWQGRAGSCCPGVSPWIISA